MCRRSGAYSLDSCLPSFKRMRNRDWRNCTLRTSSACHSVNMGIVRKQLCYPLRFHLTLCAGKEPRSPLANGRIEGWVQIRVAGQTDWKRLWMVLQCGASVQQVQNSCRIRRPPGIACPISFRARIHHRNCPNHRNHILHCSTLQRPRTGNVRG